MQNLTATQARKITENALLNKKRQDREREEEYQKVLEQYIEAVNQDIQEAAEHSETCVDSILSWSRKFDIPMKKHYKQLGYFVYIHESSPLIGGRHIRISWNRNPIKRFFEVFFF